MRSPVRHAMGDAVADAYGEAGSAALFAGEGREVGRDIARRSFANALAVAQRRDHSPSLIGAPACQLRGVS